MDREIPLERSEEEEQEEQPRPRVQGGGPLVVVAEDDDQLRWRTCRRIDHTGGIGAGFPSSSSRTITKSASVTFSMMSVR